MKTVPANLATDLTTTVTSFCHLLKLTRKDGTVMGFTDHDQDLTIDGVTYEARSAHGISAVTCTTNMAVDNFDIESMISSDAITRADLEGGKYDYAEWSLYLVNWRDLSHGKLSISRGHFGEVTYGKRRFKCMAVSLYDAFNQNIGRLVGPDCDADFGDSRCTKVVADHAGEVSSVTSRRLFGFITDTCAANYHRGGKLTWSTGDNTGMETEIKAHTTGVLTLAVEMPSEIQVGDTFVMTPGCAKTRNACIAHDNIINFRGFPDLPGLGEMLDWGYREQ